MIKLYYCITHDAGPWSEDAKGSDDKSIVKFHRNLNCKVIEVKDKTKLKGKANWEHTEIELEATGHLISNCDEMLSEVIAYYKRGKICLIKNKWQYLYPIGSYFKLGEKL